MTDRETLIRNYIQRQKDLAEVQERFKNRNLYINLNICIS